MTAPGLLAQRYRMGRVLGRGGMGSVYAAHDALLERDVAVKLLDVSTAPAAAVDRFRREAQFLAGLSHPNVVTVFDFGTDDANAWLVMELLTGPTLQQLLDRQGRLPVDDVVRFAGQCASALTAAHAAGITHRDVKPANVMLAADGRCKVLDLGIARLSGIASTQPALTQAGTILGTVPYLAPEIITGGTPGPASDVYALGGTVFALLTGHPPFPGEDPSAAMAQHVHAPTPHAAAERPDVPAELDQLLVAMLAKDPDHRPSAADVVARLDGSSAAAVAPTLAVAPSAFADQRTRQLDAAPATGSVSGSDSEWVGGLPTPVRSPQRRRRALVAVAVAALAALVVGLVVALTSGGSSDGTGRAAGSGSSAGTSSTGAGPTTSPSQRTQPTQRTASTTPRPPTNLAEAVSALRNRISRALATGGIRPRDAATLLDTVDRLGAASSTNGIGNGFLADDNGNGNGDDNGHGKHKHDQPSSGATSSATSVSGLIAHLAAQLQGMHEQHTISAAAYSSISSALDVVRSFVPHGG